METIDDPVLRKQSIGILVGHIKAHFPKVLEEYGVDQAYKLIKQTILSEFFENIQNRRKNIEKFFLLEIITSKNRRMKSTH